MDEIIRGRKDQLDQLTPPVRIILPIKTNQSSSSSENVRLRRSLVTYINQRAYFQEVYAKSQKVCSRLLQEQHDLNEQNNVLIRRNRELQLVIESHEQSNEALQKQLAAAHDDERGSQSHWMREAINQLAGDLERERVNRKGLESKLMETERERDLLRKTSEQQLKDLQTRQEEGEESWRERVKILHEQVLLANNLKDEYKKRLK